MNAAPLLTEPSGLPERHLTLVQTLAPAVYPLDAVWRVTAKDPTTPELGSSPRSVRYCDQHGWEYRTKEQTGRTVGLYWRHLPWSNTLTTSRDASRIASQLYGPGPEVTNESADYQAPTTDPVASELETYYLSISYRPWCSPEDDDAAQRERCERCGAPSLRHIGLHYNRRPVAIYHCDRCGFEREC
jgi:hypothetical protein